MPKREIKKSPRFDPDVNELAFITVTDENGKVVAGIKPPKKKPKKKGAKR